MLSVAWASNSQAAMGSTASDWIATDYGQIRLVSGVTAVGERASIPMGVQIKLKPDWKTYWRSPGDSGIPPRFEWTGSQNLRSANVRWPAPRRYTSFGLETIGYKDEVIFPIVLEVKKPGRSIIAAVVVDYAVCRDICVPLQARLNLNVPTGPSTDSEHAPLLMRFDDLVPKKGGSEGPVLKELRQTNTQGSQQLHASITGITDSGKLDVFVEAGDSFGFGPPRVTRGQESDKVEIGIPVYRYRKKAELTSMPIILTLVSGSSAFEWSVPLSAD